MRTLTVAPSGAFEVRQVSRPTPGPGQLLLRMVAASLNFRDLVLLDQGHAHAGPWPPFSDGCGYIEEVGEGVGDWAVGQRVAPLFFQGWDGGPPDRVRLSRSLGGPVPGVGAEYIVLDAAGVARVPDHLSDVGVASLPCAALTAWHALFEGVEATPGADVLLIGTGGVSIFALQFAVAAGMRPIIISSSDEKLDRCRAMGAAVAINYREVSDWHRAVRAATGGRGVDHVLEVGGAATIARSLKAVRVGGQVTTIGAVGGYMLEIEAMATISNAIRLRGVNVGSRDMFERMSRCIGLHRIEPVVDHVYDWTETNEAIAALREGRHFGKIAITISEALE